MRELTIDTKTPLTQNGEIMMLESTGEIKPANAALKTRQVTRCSTVITNRFTAGKVQYYLVTLEIRVFNVHYYLVTLDTTSGNVHYYNFTLDIKFGNVHYYLVRGEDSYKQSKLLNAPIFSTKHRI